MKGPYWGRLGLVNRDKSTKRWYNHRFSSPRSRGQGTSGGAGQPISGRRRCRQSLIPHFAEQSRDRMSASLMALVSEALAEVSQAATYPFLRTHRITSNFF